MDALLTRYPAIQRITHDRSKTSEVTLRPENGIERTPRYLARHPPDSSGNWAACNSLCYAELGNSESRAGRGPQRWNRGMATTRPNETIGSAIVAFVRKSPANRPVHLDGGPFWAEPLVGFASGDDPILEQYKGIIGELHMTPQEIMLLHLADASLSGRDADPEEANVVSWALSASELMRRINRRETEYPSIPWAHGYHYGDLFNRVLREHVVSVIEHIRGRAVAPKR